MAENNDLTTSPVPSTTLLGYCSTVYSDLVNGACVNGKKFKQRTVIVNNATGETSDDTVTRCYRCVDNCWGPCKTGPKSVVTHPPGGFTKTVTREACTC